METRNLMPKKRSKARSLTRVFIILALVLAVAGGLATSYTGHTPDPPEPQQIDDGRSAPLLGELRPNGLRLVSTGRSDASVVLAREQFTGRVRHAYGIATEIPEVLNQLYCWCGCIDRGEHRSSLQCFEDLMGVTCEVCQRTAEIAYAMSQDGSDAAHIQASVDAELAPPSSVRSAGT